MDINEASKIILTKDHNGDLLEALRAVIKQPENFSDSVKAKVVELLGTLVVDSAERTKEVVQEFRTKK